MGLDKLIKREIGITIAVVLLVTTVFLMFSYSVFTVEVSGEKNTIKFGDISLQFCQDDTCAATIPNKGNIIGTVTENGVTRHIPIYPQNNPTTAEEWDTLSPYTFALTNDGELDLYVSIHLSKDISNSYTQDDVVYSTPVNDDQIQIAIGCGDPAAEITPTIKLFSATKNPDKENDYIIASDLVIGKDETKKCNLYAWLKSDAVNENQGRYFTTQITAKGEFIPES